MRKKRNRKKAVITTIILLAFFAGIRLIGIPANKKLDKIREASESVKSELLVQQEKEAEIKDFIEKTEQGKGLFGSVGRYDSSFGELKYLSGLLDGTTEYDLDFSEPYTQDGIFVRRKVQVDFTAESYFRADGIIDGLISCPYRLILESIDMEPSIGRGSDQYITAKVKCPVSVRVSVVFIERCIEGGDNPGLKYLNSPAA